MIRQLFCSKMIKIKVLTTSEQFYAGNINHQTRELN